MVNFGCGRSSRQAMNVAPEFAVTARCDALKAKFELSEHQGKIVVLHFLLNSETIRVLLAGFPFHFSGVDDRVGQLFGGPRVVMASDGPRSLPDALQILAENLRHGVRDGRRFGHRHVLSIRHQLVGLLRSGGADHRAAHGL